MADKDFNMRIRHKIDTWDNWNKIASTFVPLDGEIILYKQDSKNDLAMKVGDGTNTLANLTWVEVNRRNTIYSISEGTGIASYGKIATIKPKSPYIDRRIIMEYTGREKEGKLVLQFSNSSTSDPSIYLLCTSGTSPLTFYMIKTADSTWELYVTLPAWMTMCVTNLKIPLNTNQLEWQWDTSNNNVVTAIPTEYLQKIENTREYNYMRVAEAASADTTVQSLKTLQISSSKDDNHPLLFSYITDPENSPQSIAYNTGITVNPKTGTITATLFAGAATHMYVTSNAPLASAERPVWFSHADDLSSTQHRLCTHSALQFNPVTATLTVTNLAGNAETASKLKTPRTITVGNQANSFDGSANISFNRHSMKVAYGDEVSYGADTTVGWCRVAYTRVGIGNCNAIFTIVGEALSSYHTAMTIEAGTSYGVTGGTTINVLNVHNYYTAFFTKARIVYHTTYTDNYAYLEVYKNSVNSGTIYVKTLGGQGWNITTTQTTGSIPDGYSTKEVTLNNAAITAEKFYGNLIGEANTATVATYVSSLQDTTSSTNSNRPVWFTNSSDVSTVNKRLVWNPNFQYNPVTNILTVGSITGSAAKLTTARTIFGQSFDGSSNVTGKGVFYNTSTIEDYTKPQYASTVSIELRANNQTTDNLGIAAGPSIGFHWSGITAGTLVFNADGKFYLRALNGTDRATLDANIIGNVTGNVSGTAANVTGIVDITHGGTNASTVAAARANLMTNVNSYGTSSASGTMELLGIYPAPIADNGAIYKVTLSKLFTDYISGQISNSFAKIDGSNATGPWSIDISGTATTATKANAVTIKDTRDLNSPPNAYDYYFGTDFKYTTTIGLPSTYSTFSGIINFAPWGDTSGGSAYQLAFSTLKDNSSSPRLSIRAADLDSTSWTGDWYKIYTSIDKPTPSEIGAIAQDNTYTTAASIYNASKSYTDTAINNLIGGAPSTLDTLKEIADQLETTGDMFDSYVLKTSMASYLAPYAKLQLANNLIHNSNEFTFVPGSFNNYVWFNYRDASGNTSSSTISRYLMGNARMGYASVVMDKLHLGGNGTSPVTTIEYDSTNKCINFIFI